jgi:flagellar biosynthesis GTPase FlhF
MKFYKFTESESSKLINLKLTAAEWRVWAFLITSVPFGDNYQELPSTLEIMSRCNVGKTTFYKAIAKLQEAEIFDFQDNGFSARNLTDVSSSEKRTTFRKSEQLSEKTENSSQNRTTFRENEQLSEKAENQAPKPAPRKEPTLPQTIQTIQTNKTSSEVEIFEELNNFSMQLMRVGIRVQVYQGDSLVFNPALKSIAVFLSETSPEMRSLAIRQFLGWIENKRNIQDIHAMFYTSIKNFIEHNS